MFFYKHALSLHNDPYAKPSAKKIPEATVFPVLFYNRRPLPDAGGVSC